MTNKCVKEIVDLLMYSRFTTCFGKWLPSSGGRRYLRSYSSRVCMWTYTDYDPSSVARGRGFQGQLATLDGS
jgi:hypothetical protein